MGRDRTAAAGVTARPTLGSLLASMFKIGLIGFGGGSALIPVMEKELVVRHRFLDEGAYTMHTIIANVTPGALPVKLAALAGGRVRGALASLLSAIAVALPGAVATVAFLAVFNLLGPSVIRYVEFAAVGITAFIIVLLMHYITKVMRSGGPRLGRYLAILVVSWLLTGASGLIQVLGMLFGVTVGISLPTLSAVQLIVLAFAAIGLLSLRKVTPAHAGDISVMGEPLPDARDKFQALGLYLTVCIAALGIALVLAGPTGGSLLGLVGFSTITSFGGGEAYVGVADGFFVESDMISSAVFYGQIVPVANALPGPILVKIAAGIGYAYGVALDGPALGAVFAVCAFLMAISACCAVVVAVITAWTKVARSAFMINLGRYILPVICGLLMSTSVSMVLANAHIAERGGLPGTPVAWATLVAVGVLWWAQHRFKTPDLVLLGLAGGVSLVGLALVAG